MKKLEKGLYANLNIAKASEMTELAKKVSALEAKSTNMNNIMITLMAVNTAMTVVSTVKSMLPVKEKETVVVHETIEPEIEEPADADENAEG